MQTQTVSFSSGARQVDAYLARPDGEGPFPGVVIIHEIYGLNENIRDIARRFANEGYAALAVDLFTGRNRTICMFRFMGQMLLRPLNNSSLNDLKAALTYLSTQPGIDNARVGAIGFCMGGGFAIAWACTDDRLKVIAPFYGANPRPFEAVARLCPVVGSYPEKDFTAAAGRKLDEALDRFNIRHDIKIYPGARHSFFNDQGSRYDAAASQDAWQRVLTFFNEQIGAPSRAKS
ncbi:MAG TPA: dienelactone hydrolase family protein [Ktedonobacteraceae bacterium]|jgi:carboxymethylenebutenolidase|nr:dienelactone hydrolase family protein [Ktedonobacteraceae bacterium]